MGSQATSSQTRSGGELVSIVLPTYNGARYLRQSVASCLAQTYPDMELIVVVDGSTDDTQAVLASFSDPRLQVICHDRNRGLPEALNTGFAHATGCYLTWTSDDNWYAPDAIAEMVQCLRQHPEVGLVYTDMWLVDDEGKTLSELSALAPDHLRVQPWNGVHACFMYTRQAREAVGDYDPATRLAEDYDYWLRIAEQFAILPLHKPLYHYRQHATSLTGTRGRYAAARQILRIRRRRKWMRWPEYLYWSAYLDMDAAFWHWHQGNKQQTRYMALKSLVKNPANARNIGLLSILGEAVLGTRLALVLRRVGRNLVLRAPGTGPRSSNHLS
jgi:glycosyltransferase involved in cell wall biosynthesis